MIVDLLDPEINMMSEEGSERDEYIKIFTQNCPFLVGAVVAVIVWYLDLQLPMQSVPITTDVVSSNLDQGEVYNFGISTFFLCKR
jgi:hypothetical protein